MTIGESYSDTLQAEVDHLRAELKIKSEFISSRQCPDHNGKWERGTCLQCEVERLRQELSKSEKKVECCLGKQSLLGFSLIKAHDKATAAEALVINHEGHIAKLEAALATARKDALESVDRKLSDKANNYTGTIEDYYCHGLWMARDVVRALAQKEE